MEQVSMSVPSTHQNPGQPADAWRLSRTIDFSHRDRVATNMTSHSNRLNPGFNRTECNYAGGDPSKLDNRTSEAIRYGHKNGWQSKFMLQIPPKERKKKYIPPPLTPPPTPKLAPAWKKMREGDNFGDLDLMEAVGTLELALYVPAPLCWDSQGRRRKQGGGFVTTVSDLSNSAELKQGCHTAGGKKEYASMLKDLVQKTGAIAMMVERTTDDPAVSKERNKAPPSHQLKKVMRQVKKALASNSEAVATFRSFDKNDDGTLELFEFRKGMEQLGVVASEGDLLSLFRRVANERDGFIRYEDFIKIFAPQAATDSMAALHGTVLNNLGCLLGSEAKAEPRRAAELLAQGVRRQQANAGSASNETLARQLFAKVDTDGSGGIEEPEIAALSARLGRPLRAKQLAEAMAQMDADGSGEVDVEEFVEWFQREKAIDLVISHLNLAGALGGIHKCAEALEHTVFAERVLKESVLKGKKPQTRSHGSIAAVTCYSRASALQAATSSHDITVQARIYYSKAAALAQRWWGADSELAAAFTKKLDHFTRRTKQGLAALGPAARLHALQVPVSAVAAVEPWLPSGGRVPRPALTTLMDTGGFSSSLRSTQSSFLASEAGSRPVSVAGSAFEEEEEPSWRLKGDPARTGRLEEVASVVGLPDSAMDELERAWAKRDDLAARSQYRAASKLENSMAAYKQLLPYL